MWLRKKIAYAIIDIHMQLLQEGLIRELSIPYTNPFLKAVPYLMGWKDVLKQNKNRKFKFSVSSLSLKRKSA